MPESDDKAKELVSSEDRFANSLGDEVTQGSDTDVFSLGDESTTGEVYDPDGGYVPEGEELVDLSKRYRVDDTPLGRGGFSEVFGAFDERLNRRVAIKRISGKVASSSKAVKRFLIEGRAVAGLSHPNLIEIYDYGYSTEGPFLIMEYVSGGSLLDKSRAEGALSPDVAVSLFAQLCDGLAKAHSAGITHRDIKPANILITEDGIPKLTDFGLAKDESADMSMTATGAVMGTYDFMPSEQREGIHLTDHRSDLWSLAATFYQMLTGKSPKVINLHSVPESLQQVLAKALEESPTDRYQSALEMKEAVLQIHSGRKDATRELGKGECPSCGELNPPGNKFCKGCSDPLLVKCLDCREELPIWEAHCGECGQQQSELLKFIASTLQQQRDKAESLLNEMKFTEALEVAREVADQEDPRLQNFLAWYQEFKQRVDVERDSAHSHVQQLLLQAQTHEEAEDYEAGLRTLEQIHPTLLHLKLADTDWDADSLKQHLQEQREQFALLEANLVSCMDNGKAYLKSFRFEEAIRAVAPLKNLTRRGLERYTLWHEKFVSLVEEHRERELPGLRLTLGQALACEERGDIEGAQEVLGELQPALLNLRVEGLATGTEILKRIGGDLAWVENSREYFKKIRVRAERLLGTSAFDEALREAGKIDTQGHSQLEVYEQWRIKFTKAVEATREAAYTEVRDRIAKALSCEESYEYAEGLTYLKGVKRVLLEAHVGLPVTGLMLGSRLQQAAIRVSELEREIEASPKTLSVLPLLDELYQLCPNRLELKALQLKIREGITEKELRNKEADEKLHNQLASAQFQQVINTISAIPTEERDQRLQDAFTLAKSLHKKQQRVFGLHINATSTNEWRAAITKTQTYLRDLRRLKIQDHLAIDNLNHAREKAYPMLATLIRCRSVTTQTFRGVRRAIGEKLRSRSLKPSTPPSGNISNAKTNHSRNLISSETNSESTKASTSNTRVKSILRVLLGGVVTGILLGVSLLILSNPTDKNTLLVSETINSTDADSDNSELTNQPTNQEEILLPEGPVPRLSPPHATPDNPVLTNQPTDLEDNYELPPPENIDPNNPEEMEKVNQDREVAEQLQKDFDTNNANLPDIDSVKRRINEATGTNKTVLARDPRVRKQIVAREGGTTATEAAVARGLEWLARHQEPAGHWSLHKFNAQPSCTCQNPGQTITDAGATALALLPFLGAGQTHIAGMYKDEVRAGLDFLLDNQAPDGDLSTGARGNTRLYTHGQAAIVLCEAYMMSGDQRLKQPAQNAITFIIAAQHHQGGWRYNPGQPGDTSVVGWQIMALQSARAAGLQVPNSVLQKANQFLNSVQAPNQLYAYQPRVSPTHVMTAEAILCRYYLGHGRNASTIATGINHLIDNHLPNRSGENIYYLYYGTQVMHHYGGPEWDLWNDQMRELLISTQHSNGHRRGSWTPKENHDRQGGRLYATAMAICCLEVYYRHLPIFRKFEVK